MKAIVRLAIIYFFIGCVIVTAQSFTGTHCDPPRTVPAATAGYPPGIVSALLWPASFYEKVWKGGASLGEYLSPETCIEAS